MTAASLPQMLTLRSGDVVRLRQVRPSDAPALARAYANLGEQSRYRRFFTVMPELPEATADAGVTVIDQWQVTALLKRSSVDPQVPDAPLCRPPELRS